MALRPKAKATAERMPTLLKSIVVEEPVETVFGFHEREERHATLESKVPSAAGDLKDRRHQTWIESRT